ncbi:MAG: lipid-A-disaccharide synthase N-terminal domain-containing protein [Planctomycetota bacterium]
MKAGPIAAMVVLIGLGVWLVAGGPPRPDVGPGHEAPRPVRVGTSKLWLDTWESEPGEVRHRILDADGGGGQELTQEQMESFLGPAAAELRPGRSENWLFRVLNITDWASLAWIAVGFGGQAAFFGRMFVQWVASERSRQSIVPPMFWYLSLVGGVCLFAYFVWRQDVVGVLGQSSGVVIYARNVRLLYKQRRREARNRDSAEQNPEGSGHPKPVGQERAVDATLQESST